MAIPEQVWRGFELVKARKPDHFVVLCSGQPLKYPTKGGVVHVLFVFGLRDQCSGMDTAAVVMAGYLKSGSKRRGYYGFTWRYVLRKVNKYEWLSRNT